MPGRFPWSAAKRTIVRKTLTLTLYKDGSRLYKFKHGGYLVLTPQGVSILKADPRAVKKYLKGEKLYLLSSGNSDIFMINPNKTPTIAKEHRMGISAQTQMEHIRKIKGALEREGSSHRAPEYYAVGAFPQGKGTRDISVMEYINAKKMEEVSEELIMKGDKKSMHLRNLMLNQYKKFQRLLKQKRLPLTDLHEGNVLAKYDEQTKRFRFTIIDQ